MNTKIWFLLLAAGALSCAGCASETAQQIQGFELRAQQIVEKKSGKQRKDWGPAETAEYNRLFLHALPQVEPRDYVRLNPITGQWEYGNGIQNVWPVGDAGNVIETHEQKAGTR